VLARFLILSRTSLLTVMGSSKPLYPGSQTGAAGLTGKATSLTGGARDLFGKTSVVGGAGGGGVPREVIPAYEFRGVDAGVSELEEELSLSVRF